MVRESSEMPDCEAPAGAGLPAEGDPASLVAWARELVARAREDGVALTGEGGLLTDLVREVLQTGLEVELTEHLGVRAARAASQHRQHELELVSKCLVASGGVSLAPET